MALIQELFIGFHDNRITNGMELTRLRNASCFAKASTGQVAAARQEKSGRFDVKSVLTRHSFGPQLTSTLYLLIDNDIVAD
jgi:hypothetical protein